MPIAPQTTCRCRTATHGHAPGQCGRVATEPEGYCKYCHDRAAVELLMTNPQVSIDDARQIAVNSLTTATSAAAEFGFTKVADAGLKVQYFIIREIGPTENNEAIPEPKIAELKSRVSSLADQVREVQKAEAWNPQTESFKCLQDFQGCWTMAQNSAVQFMCLLAFAACIGQQFTTLVERD